MSSYWEGVKRRWRGVVDTPHPPKKDTVTGGFGTEPDSDPGKEWELVYQKFRQIEGRDPYSFQELVDWWNRS